MINYNGKTTWEGLWQTLLSLSMNRRILGASPLAFGEHDVKGRIKNVLNFKKRSRIIIIAAVALVAVLTIGLAVNRAAVEPFHVAAAATFDGKPQTLVLGKNDNPPFVDLGSVITLTFSGEFPDTFSITDIVVNKDGSRKYNAQSDSPVAFEIVDNTVSFVVDKNWSTALSSNSKDYEPGSSYRWYKIVVNYGGNSTEELGVWIRTDPAVIFERLSASTDYTPREWLDFYRDDELPWTESRDITLPEFPGVTFTWTPEKVTDGEQDLFFGSPVWNVYLADLTNDGKPELCATVSFGSGIIDTRVIVYDYAESKSYILSDRWYYDYYLSLQNGQLVATQTKYNDDKPTMTSELRIVDGELYLPGGQIQTRFEADPQPDDYMLTMSGVPGIMLGYNGQSDVPAKMQYTCESGSFGLLEDNIITTLGSYAEQDFGASPRVHWTPGADTKDGDKVIMRLVSINGDFAEVSLTVRTDGVRYSLIQESVVASETTPSIENYVSYIVPENTTAPTGIVRSELLASNYIINNVFLLSQNDRKSLNGVDNVEFAIVYASYFDGDVGYCMQYYFERQTHSAEWTHGEPTLWDGIDIDVAAHVARLYYAEKYGDSFDDIGVSWAQSIITDYWVGPESGNIEFATFYIGRIGGDIPTLIVLGSPDGQSHWEVLEFNGAAVTR